eukprot:315534-Chlamydomonas_euryale.AAC.6
MSSAGDSSCRGGGRHETATDADGASHTSASHVTWRAGHGVTCTSDAYGGAEGAVPPPQPSPPPPPLRGSPQTPMPAAATRHSIRDGACSPHAPPSRASGRSSAPSQPPPALPSPRPPPPAAAPETGPWSPRAITLCSGMRLPSARP